jgi:hypothetical protein
MRLYSITVNTRSYTQGVAHIQYNRGAEDRRKRRHERLPLSREARLIHKAESTLHPFDCVPTYLCFRLGPLPPLTLRWASQQCLAGALSYTSCPSRAFPSANSYSLLVTPRRRFIANMMFHFEECMSFLPINSDYLYVPPLPRSGPSATKREKNAVRDHPSRTHASMQTTFPSPKYKLRGITLTRTELATNRKTHGIENHRSFARDPSESRFPHCQ